MSTDQLVQQLVSLRIADRVVLAQALWDSIHQAPEQNSSIEDETLRTARRRDAELEAGAVGRTHEEVMQAARRTIGCE